ncbi:MAG: hypothetical protein IPJ13_21925 [Saprospiraceae bacterium]|nr:hypothetical protein [Saprospiraceae bacterium]
MLRFRSLTISNTYLLNGNIDTKTDAGAYTYTHQVHKSMLSQKSPIAKTSSHHKHRI